MKVLVTLAPGRQRSSRSRLRLWAGGSFFSGPLESGEGGRLFKMPSNILSFCSTESSAVCRWLFFSFIKISSFLASGQVGPKWWDVTKCPAKPGRKVLGYSGPENRWKKARNIRLFQWANRNSPIRFYNAFSSCAPGSFCDFPRPCRLQSSRLSAPLGERGSRRQRTAGYPGPGLPHRWRRQAPGQEEGRPPGSIGSKLLSSISPAYNTHSPRADSHSPGHSWRTYP